MTPAISAQRAEPQVPTNASSSGSVSDTAPLMPETLKKAVEHINQLANLPDFKGATQIFVQMNEQQKTIEDKNGELAKLKDAIDGLYLRHQSLTTEMAELRTENNTLQGQLEEKEEEVFEGSRKPMLSKSRSIHSYGYVKNHSEFEEKKKENENKINKLELSESTLKEQLASERGKNQKLEADKALLEKSMQSIKGKLQKLINFTAGHSNESESSMLEQFSELWNYANDKLSAVIQEDITPDRLSYYVPLTRIEEIHTLEQLSLGGYQVSPEAEDMPLLASNSEASKTMRLAVMLAILSKQIDEEIFQPNYLSSDKRNFREVLTEVAYIDPEKESFLRSLLLSIDPEEQEKELERGARESAKSCPRS
ncbi:hypothetical protein N7470_003171 [Penicillium chermesinum]|nr:hypothetical protein N7470_003171 [Penicillium chermesinum]